MATLAARRVKHYWPVAVTFAIGCAISLHVYTLLDKQQQLALQYQIEIDAGDRAAVIIQQNELNESALTALAALYDSSRHVSRDAFRTFSNVLLKMHPSIFALEWLPRIPDAERAQHEEDTKAKGFPGYAIKELVPPRSFRRADRRTEYYPVLYIEPFDKNSMTFGLDHSSLPTRAKAMELAHTLRTTVSTDRVELLQIRSGTQAFSELSATKEGQFGFLVYKPVLQQEQLAGFVAGVFQVRDVVETALNTLRPVAMDVYIYDMSAQPDKQLLYYSPSPFRTASDRELLFRPSDIPLLDTMHYVKEYKVFGRDRMLLFIPTSVYFANAQTRLPWMGAVGIGLFTFCIAGFVLIIVRKEAKRQQAEVVRMRSEFISIVSHELRTPLSVIKGGIDVFYDGLVGPVNAEQADMLLTIKRNIDRLSRLINDVLDFQKLDAGRMQYNFGEHNLHALVASVVSDFLGETEKKGLRLVCDVPEQELKVVCDRDRITQVMFNLLSNAVKFTDHGVIDVSVGRVDGGVRVRVKDQGVGIRQEDLDTLFESFGQVTTVDNRKPGGTGLGLSISKKILEAHQGSMDVDSEFGHGSTFSFTLPLAARGDGQRKP